MSKPKIYMSTHFRCLSIPQELLDKYDFIIHATAGLPTREDLLRDTHNVIAIVLIGHAKIDKQVIDNAGPNLKIISNHGAGYDAIDHRYAEEKGIWVSNTPGLVSTACADLAVALLLIASRRIVESERWVLQGNFAGGWNMWHGSDPEGKIVGIFGMGGIGKAFAKRVHAFDMKILYYNRRQLPKEEEEKYKATYATKQELLQQADYITLHVPLNQDTRHFLKKEDFDLMKNGVIIINTSRGAIIHEQALVDALKSGKVKAAALDVVENEPEVHPELRKMPNVTLTPHIGTCTFETRRTMEQLALENLVRVLNGQEPLTPVTNPKQKSNPKM